MREDNIKFKQKYKNKDNNQNELEMVSDEDIKRALELRNNRTDTRLSAEEVIKIRKKLNLEESLVDIIYKRDIDGTSKLEKNRTDRRLSKETINKAIEEKKSRRTKSKKQNESLAKKVCDDKEIGD